MQGNWGFYNESGCQSRVYIEFIFNYTGNGWDYQKGLERDTVIHRL